MKHYAAIDIGTNSGRLLIGTVSHENNLARINKVLFTRVPLSLGGDIYTTGIISEKKREQMLHTFLAFKHLIKAYNVSEYRAIATSAMREATNGSDICNYILKDTGIELEVIDGETEANLVFETFKTCQIDHNIPYLFIDVGGGSTELSVVLLGKKINSTSFNVGSLRVIKNRVPENTWREIDLWISQNCNPNLKITGIGTGGNINKIFKLNKKKPLETLSASEIENTLTHIESFSYKDRVEKLQLKPDRAEVIIPAGEIYLRIMKMAKIKRIIVPKMGLADGVIYDLFNTSIGVTK